MYELLSHEAQKYSCETWEYEKEKERRLLQSFDEGESTMAP